jgi:hypothetical protein
MSFLRDDNELDNLSKSIDEKLKKIAIIQEEIRNKLSKEYDSVNNVAQSANNKPIDEKIKQLAVIQEEIRNILSKEYDSVHNIAQSVNDQSSVLKENIPSLLSKIYMLSTTPLSWGVKLVDEQLSSLIQPKISEGTVDKYVKAIGYDSAQEYRDVLRNMDDQGLRDHYNKITETLYWQTLKELQSNYGNYEDPSEMAKEVFEIRNSIKADHRVETSILGKASIALYNMYKYGKFAGPEFEDLARKKSAMDIIISSYKTGGKDMGLKSNAVEDIINISKELSKIGIASGALSFSDNAYDAFKYHQADGSDMFEAYLLSKDYMWHNTHYEWVMRDFDSVNIKHEELASDSGEANISSAEQAG